MSVETSCPPPPDKASTPPREGFGKLTAWDIAYSLNMGAACLISYMTITLALARFVGQDSRYLGGMWATVATVFVFRDTRVSSMQAGLARLIATLVSFALCFVYFLFFAFSPLGLAVLIATGTLLLFLLDRSEDIVTTGITTSVVMVASAMSAQPAWQEPLLRVVDTVVGVAIGVACKLVASFLFSRWAGERLR